VCTRVRRFQQDNAHIFCYKWRSRFSMACLFRSWFCVQLMFVHATRKVLGRYSNLERGGESIGGEFECIWSTVDSQSSGWRILWRILIDITIMDALKRPHQTVTIQLDFQLPIRFNLSYVK